MSAHYTSSLIGRLPATDAFCGQEKIHDCAWMSSPPKGASRASLVYAGKNKVRYFLNTPRIW
jgi:hypothetical protein